MSAPKLLIIEDDAAIRRGVADAVRFAGYEPLEAADGRLGREMALRREYALLLLDLVLPHRDGLEILREVRAVRPTLPVVILTARGDEDDRIAGLNLGADDYVVKPFSVRELLARVEAVLRRSPQRPRDVVRVPVLSGVADLAVAEVRYHDGRRVELSERECDLLRYLAIHAGRAVSREELLENVWRLNPRGLATRTVDVHIARLREKLQDDSSKPRIIVTVRGQGYLFRAAEPVDQETP